MKNGMQNTKVKRYFILFIFVVSKIAIITELKIGKSFNERFMVGH